MDGIKAGSGGAGDVEIIFRTEGQMIGGDGRLKRGEDVDLALRG